jgi:hypothetical protein
VSAVPWQEPRPARLLTKDEAAAASAAAVAECAAIQANLLDLDGSEGKRLLAGASLAGVSRQRWETAAAGLTALWDTFGAYSAVVEGAAKLLARIRQPTAAQLAELTSLLTGPSVELTRPAAPLNQRDLTAAPRAELTLAAAVREMRHTFASVADVVTVAERVRREAGSELDQAASDLTEARHQAGQFTDPTFAAQLAAAESELGQVRGRLDTDPLSLWRDSEVDKAEAGAVRERAAGMLAKARTFAQLRDDAQSQRAAVTAAVAAATAAWQDAVATHERACARIAEVNVQPPPRADDLATRLDALAGLTAAGQWRQLATKLTAIQRRAAVVTRKCQESQQAAAALLGRRTELRRLLEGCRARAASLGAAEDPGLRERYVQARDLLWAAPCDLTAAAGAVTSYQQAVTALTVAAG